MTDTIHRFGSGTTYHRLYEYADGRISILDHSSNDPDQTDDGPLIVEPGTVCELDVTQRGEIVVIVPVLCTRDDSDGRCYIGIPVAERLFQLVPRLKISKNPKYRIEEQKMLRTSLLFNQFGIEYDFGWLKD